ncbi:MAG: TIGR02147 family protein [Chitinispirillaceae bacterium]|nr:TIGR02147 family protein [Chitinispirillaceae bacterium]
MTSEQKKTVDIYNYFDYREYLNAVYHARKQRNNGFSHRLFSREAGITSPNYLFRVLKGERTLGSAYIEKFCKALHLTPGESLYFTTLVLFNNEPEIAKKESLLRTLLSLRYRRGLHRIDDKKLKFFSKWYYPVIRELAAILQFKGDCNLLARNCVPRITSRQAANAVAYLLKAGFLKKGVDGCFIRTDPVISSGDEVRSTVLRNYHRQTLNQSMEALDSIEPENRDISSLTLSVSGNTYLAIKKEIRNFRKHLLAMAQADEHPEMVCLAGFQLFPRSRMNMKKRRRGRTQ